MSRKTFPVWVVVLVVGIPMLCCLGAALDGGDKKVPSPASASARPAAPVTPEDSPSPTPATDHFDTSAAASPAVTTPAATVAPAKPSAAPPARPAEPYYRNCDAARAAGAAPLYQGDPGYRPALDADGDGEACEPRSGNGDTGPAPAGDVYYANCSAVRAAGAAPLHSGDPGYSRKLDRDGDGVACE
jgi:hypothetical protein